MNDNIERLIEKTREEKERPNSYPFLPEILESLLRMRENLNETRERREKLASALERLVLEDFSFSESKLGGEILEIAESFAN